MEKLLILILLVMIPATVTAQIITFTQTSSAKSSTPNLRIGLMRGPLPVAPGTSASMQTATVDAIQNYYLTKTKTLNVGSPTAYGYMIIQVDQDTKMYIDSDATNYMTIPSGTSNFGFAPRN